MQSQSDPIWITDVRAGASQGIILAGAGLFWGAVAGWVTVLLNQANPQQPALVAGNLYSWLALWLPLCLLIVTGRQIARSGGMWRGLYLEPASSLTILLVAAIIGALAGTALYLVPATNLPAIFLQLDAARVSAAIRDEIGLARIGLVVGVTLLAALVIGFASSWYVRR